MQQPFRYECDPGIDHNLKGKCNNAWQQTVANFRNSMPGAPFSEVLKAASAAYRADNGLPPLTAEEKLVKKNQAAHNKRVRKEAIRLGWLGPGMKLTKNMRAAIENNQHNVPQWVIPDVRGVETKGTVAYPAPPIPQAPPLPPRRAPRNPNLRIEPAPFVPARAPRAPVLQQLPDHVIGMIRSPPVGSALRPRRRPVSISASAYGPMPKLVTSVRPTQFPKLVY